MIIYFSGTGNSRFVAERIASKLSDELFNAAASIQAERGVVFTTSASYVFAAPVYAAAPPLIFMDFIRECKFPKGSPAYFVMTCAAGMGASPAYCQKLSLEKGLDYMGTARITMPQNYIPYFRMETPEENKRKIDAALPVIDSVADSICSGRPLLDSGMKTWERLLTPVVLKPYYKFFISAKAFAVTENCVGCGKCIRVCPLGNITLSGKKPIWGSRCTHCMACINLCPKNAVEYGKRTHGKLRYHGPESCFSE